MHTLTYSSMPSALRYPGWKRSAKHLRLGGCYWCQTRVSWVSPLAVSFTSPPYSSPANATVLLSLSRLLRHVTFCRRRLLYLITALTMATPHTAQSTAPMMELTTTIAMVLDLCCWGRDPAVVISTARSVLTNSKSTTKWTHRPYS